jgi:hypothetical protein
VARKRSEQFGTQYDDSGTYSKRHRLWAWADCSSFVWGGFADPIIDPDDPMSETNRSTGQSMAEKLGWPSFNAGVTGGAHIPSTLQMKETFSSSALVSRLWGYDQDKGEVDGARVFDIIKRIGKKGDILLRYDHPDKPEPDHVGFLWGVGENNTFNVLHCASPSQDVTITTYSSNSTQYNYGARVFPSSRNQVDEDSVDFDAVYNWDGDD